LSGSWQQRDRRGPRRPEDPIKDGIVSNERIRYPEVRVIGEDGSQLGIMQTRQALWTARDRGMDLIEITAEATPPVVRIVDLNKWIYNLRRAKKEQERKARENATTIKEIQLRPVTDKHDIEVKQNHAKEFLADASKVKIVIKFRGRELAFAQRGFEIMETFISGIGPCKIEKAPEMNGRMLMAILAPQVKKA
jgi:translation initiation factor IF-3